jgi:hypothetical protein
MVRFANKRWLKVLSFAAVCAAGIYVVTATVVTSAQEHINTPGTFITFDAPGAGVYVTQPTGISAPGAITGFSFDTNGGTTHGFLRTRQGTLTTFDAPGAVN